MFLPLSADFLDILYYEMGASPFSFVLFYYVLSVVVILMGGLMIVLMVTMVVRSSSIMFSYLHVK
jgi:hypothetical protein